MRETVSLPGRALSLGLDEQGELWLRDASKDFRPVRFNEQYRGYYPPCRFTAIAATEKGFVAAAVDGQEKPLLFRSMLGGVWERAELVCREGIPSGRIIRILVGEKPEQLFLCCDNGELITVPDCPRCMKLRRVSNETVLDAALCGDQILLTLQKDASVAVPLRELSQMRVHPDWALKALSQGAALVDLGCHPASPFAQSWAKVLLARAERVEAEALEDWLPMQSKDRKLIFLCDYGVQAERAAGTARRLGYAQAYFLDGICLPREGEGNA